MKMLCMQWQQAGGFAWSLWLAAVILRIRRVAKQRQESVSERAA